MDNNTSMDSNDIPDIRVEDPSGQEIHASLSPSPYLTGPDNHPSVDLYNPYDDGHLLDRIGGQYMQTIAYVPQSEGGSSHISASFTPPFADCNWSSYRNPGTPSDDGNLHSFPFWSSAQSSPQSGFEQEFPDQSPLLTFSPGIQPQQLTARLDDFIISDYLESGPDSGSGAESDLFGSGMPNEQDTNLLGLSQPPLTLGPYPVSNSSSAPPPNSANNKALRVDVDFAVPGEYSAGTSSLNSGQESGQSFLIPNAPPLGLRDKNERHSFSGDVQYRRLDPSSVVGRPRRRTHSSVMSAPTTPQYSTVSLPDTFADEDEWGNDGPGANESSPVSSFSPSAPVAKQVVTSARMKRASQGRRKHAATFICSVCEDAFTTNFSRKRHLNSHTKLNSFKCPRPNCNKEFRNASDCNRHQKKVHK